MLALETQIVSGSGTGENLTGLDAVSRAQVVAWDTNIVRTARKMLTAHGSRRTSPAGSRASASGAPGG